MTKIRENSQLNIWLNNPSTAKIKRVMYPSHRLMFIFLKFLWTLFYFHQSKTWFLQKSKVVKAKINQLIDFSFFSASEENMKDSKLSTFYYRAQYHCPSLSLISSSNPLCTKMSQEIQNGSQIKSIGDAEFVLESLDYDVLRNAIWRMLGVMWRRIIMFLVG